MSTLRYCRRANPDTRDPHTMVLLTGFGPFPGVPVNATMHLVPELAERASRAFPDVRFIAEVLPTEWQAGPRRLAALLEETEPDLVLHFGVSSRARGFEIEQRARNACQITPDAAGAMPASARLHQDGTEHLRATLPVAHIVLALKRQGIPAYASRDAGGYLCNAVLYHSLGIAAASGAARRVGCIHIPASLARPSLARPGGPNRGRTGTCPLTWPQAFAGGLTIIAGCLGRPAPVRTRTATAARF
jgi:pyroglutamyl-peptidase